MKHTVDQVQQTITTIVDPTTGEQQTARTQSETMSADPTTGDTVYTITNDYVLTPDARITTIDKTFTCRHCKRRLLSTAVARTCHDCADQVCASCARQPPRCPPCRRRYQLKRFLIWLQPT